MRPVHADHLPVAVDAPRIAIDRLRQLRADVSERVAADAVGVQSEAFRFFSPTICPTLLMSFALESAASMGTGVVVPAAHRTARPFGELPLTPAISPALLIPTAMSNDDPEIPPTGAHPDFGVMGRVSTAVRCSSAARERRYWEIARFVLTTLVVACGDSWQSWCWLSPV